MLFLYSTMDEEEWNRFFKFIWKTSEKSFRFKITLKSNRCLKKYIKSDISQDAFKNFAKVYCSRHHLNLSSWKLVWSQFWFKRLIKVFNVKKTNCVVWFGMIDKTFLWTRVIRRWGSHCPRIYWRLRNSLNSRTVTSTPN